MGGGYFGAIYFGDYTEITVRVPGVAGGLYWVRLRLRQGTSVGAFSDPVPVYLLDNPEHTDTYGPLDYEPEIGIGTVATVVADPAQPVFTEELP
jgi:hypothetical protein